MQEISWRWRTNIGEKILSEHLSVELANLSDENQASAFCSFSLIPANRMRPFFSPSAPNLHILSLKLCTLNKCSQLWPMPFEFVKIELTLTLIPRHIWIQTLALWNYSTLRERERQHLIVKLLWPPPQLSQLTCASDLQLFWTHQASKSN